jgi:hypothetical protein
MRVLEVLCEAHDAFRVGNVKGVVLDIGKPSIGGKCFRFLQLIIVF